MDFFRLSGANPRQTDPPKPRIDYIATAQFCHHELWFIDGRLSHQPASQSDRPFGSIFVKRRDMSWGYKMLHRGVLKPYRKK